MATESEHLKRLHPWLRPRAQRVLVAWRAAAGPNETLRLVESVRSTAKQQEYYARGASKADGVHQFSLHQYEPALALDCLLLRDGEIIKSVTDDAWQSYGQIAESEGLEWGGRWAFKDGPHIQVPEFQRIRLLQEQVGVTMDGAWGPKSRAALVAYEQKAKTPPHTKSSFPVHPATWRMLCRGASNGRLCPALLYTVKPGQAML